MYLVVVAVLWLFVQFMLFADVFFVFVLAGVCLFAAILLAQSTPLDLLL